MVPVCIRRGLQMTDCALAVDVVIALRGMAGQAESSIRKQTGDGRGLVARIATGVGFHGLRVRLRRVKSSVATCAILRRRMMLIVAGCAGFDCRIGIQGDRGGVTLHARQVRV